MAEGPNWQPGEDSAFAAIPLPADLAARLARPDGSAAEDMHVTVAYWPFDGQPPDTVTDDLVRVATEVAAGFAAPTVTLTHGGGFGPDGLTYALEGGPCLTLRAFHAAFVEAAAGIGMEPSDRYAYRPHTTIGTYPDGIPADLTVGPLAEPYTFTAETVAIYRNGDLAALVPFTGTVQLDQEEPAMSDTVTIDDAPAEDTAPPSGVQAAVARFRAARAAALDGLTPLANAPEDDDETAAPADGDAPAEAAPAVDDDDKDEPVVAAGSPEGDEEDDEPADAPAPDDAEAPEPEADGEAPEVVTAPAEPGAPEDDEDEQEMAAEPAAVAFTQPAPGAGPAWSSDSIVPYGILSGDGRRISPTAGLRNRPLPLPLAATFEIGSGHDGAGFAGNITAIDNRPTAAGGLPAGMGARGDHDVASSYGAESRRLMTEGRMQGVSVDLADVTVQLSDWDEATDPFGQDAIMDVTDGELIGLTHVMHPAFAQASMHAEALAAAGQPVQRGHRVVWPITADGSPDRKAEPHLAVLDSAGKTTAMGRPVGRGRFHVERMSMSLGMRPMLAATAPAAAPAVVAAGAPALAGKAKASGDDLLAQPPAAWFTNVPGVRHAITVTPDGEVLGLVARWKDCHVSYADRCVPPPRTRTGYRHYAAGRITTAEGTQVQVGPIFADTVHPTLTLAAGDAYAHYHDTGCLLAQVALYETEYGILAHGALMPGLTARQRRIAGGGKFSGDWRPLAETDWQAELISVLAVNGPGFATPGDSPLVASGGRPDSLVLVEDDVLRAAVGLGLAAADDDCAQAPDPLAMLADQIGHLAAQVETLTARVADGEARERLAIARARAARLRPTG